MMNQALELVISLDGKKDTAYSVSGYQSALCSLLRHKAVFMYVNHMDDWGYLQFPELPVDNNNNNNNNRNSIN